MDMLLRSHGLDTLVYGTRKCPVVGEDSTNEEKREQQKWMKDDAKAASLIACSLSRNIAELVLTCKHANEIWTKLLARFERSNVQRLNSLIEKFFKVERDTSEDISTHIAKLQKLFMDLNNELEKNNENRLSDKILNGRILSTLGNEFDNFKDVWDIIPAEEQTVNLLIEKLCGIEMRSEKLATDENALFVRKIVKKPEKNSRTNPKKKFPCNFCKQFGHWIAECPKRKEEEKESRKTAKRGQSAFFSAVLTATDDQSTPKDEWYCDSGASRHITHSKENFFRYRAFRSPIEIMLGKKGVKMKAFGSGNVHVKIFLNGKWQNLVLLNVWYVPDAFANLISVRAAVKHGCEVVFGSKNVLIRNVETKQTVATGYLRGNLYALNTKAIRQKNEKAIIATNNRDKQIDAMKWHRRLGHLNFVDLKKMEKNANENGVRIKKIEENTHCDICIRGKLCRSPFVKDTASKAKLLEIIHSDVCGPMKTESLGKSKYFVTFTDEKSRWTEVYFIRKKSQVLEKFKEFRAKMEKLTERKIKFLQSDNGTEYVNNEFDKYLKENGIQRRLSISYSPQQNGISERKNRTLLDMARCLLIQAGMKPSFWAEAVNTANYIRNRCPTSAQNSSPYEILFGKQPYLGHMKEFGCDVFVKNNAPNKDKFQPRAQKMIFVGYSSQSKGYRVYDPNKNKFEDVRDVYFREGRKRDNDEFENFYVHKPKPNGTETGSGNGTRSPTISNETDDTNSTGSESEESKSDDNGNVCEESSEEEVQEEPGRAPGRPKTIRTGKPGRPRKEYRIRTNKNGNSSEAPANKYKARLVARGHTQRPGIDYDEIFAPVARYELIRTLLAIAVNEQMYVHQLDVVSAYTQGFLSDEVYMEQPEAFVDKKNKDHVCKLVRPLYGLKQSGREWYKRINDYLVNKGGMNAEGDPCIYVFGTNENRVILLIYVDDILLASKSLEEMNEIKELLKREFEITDLGPINTILGINIKRDSDTGNMTLTQRNYIEELIKKFGMENAKEIGTPMELNVKVSKEMSPKDENEREEMKHKPYRELIGCLVYLSKATRPDIAFAAMTLGRYCNDPGKEHWTLAKRVLRYLKATPELGIKYSRNVKQLEAFTDSDWAGNVDDRRSCSGNVLMLAGGPISWMSKLQSSVSLSTMEAEYVAIREVTKEVVYVSRLINHMLFRHYVKEPISVYCDNQSAIELSKNPVFHKRSKHIDIAYHYARELVEKGKIELKYLRTDEMIADVFTKPLSKVKHNKFVKMLMDNRARSEEGV
ncbi:UNVERIFIED_CONTAM: hypothetical protein PYX00_009420 [Menopon gallinae]|uniref:Integrase catalytic domain-containing protein n=1 Tax=Menopon gallinae TaxID=328185 RepID=A0AAW2HBC9_9NEOP